MAEKRTAKETARVGRASAALTVLAVFGSLLVPTVTQAAEERIVLVSRRHLRADVGIHSIRPDGRDARWETFHPDWGTEPVVSPDGTRIAYMTENGSRDIWIYDRDDRSTTRLTPTSRFIERDPAWSPDGNQLVFARTPFGGPETELYVIDLSTGQETQITDTRDFDELGPAWSPDGSRILFQAVRWGTRERGVFVMNADGSDVKQLTFEQDVEPAWSPDGRRIAFTRVLNFAAAPFSSYPVVASSIFTINEDGSDQRRLTHESIVLDYAPDWSPDGTEILFTRDPDGSEPLLVWATGTTEGGPLSSLYVVGADGTGLRELTDPRTGDRHADWYAPTP